MTDVELMPNYRAIPEGKLELRRKTALDELLNEWEKRLKNLVYFDDSKILVNKIKLPNGSIVFKSQGGYRGENKLLVIRDENKPQLIWIAGQYVLGTADVDDTKPGLQTRANQVSAIQVEKSGDWQLVDRLGEGKVIKTIPRKEILAIYE